MASRDKRKIESSVLVRTREIVSRAVEEGVSLGWERAHKHTDMPTHDDITDAISRAVMDELCDILEFVDDEWADE